MKKLLKQIENRLSSEQVMGRNKQATCKMCDREMRSDHLKRHMKVHEKRKNNINVSKEDKNILLEKSDETKEDENKSPRFDMSRIKSRMRHSPCIYQTKSRHLLSFSHSTPRPHRRYGVCPS